ncbi:glycosyltransferase [Bergeyella porcorum]|uniref:glycosyltransferase n=1 Tax=Bergeyella porcorum TaxID=1735111 RepID=UPI0035E724E9
MKILISVFNNLYTDQRVEKVCRTLHNNGYEIELIGNSLEGLPPMERPYVFHRIPLRSKTLRKAYIEFQWKLYNELKTRADKHTVLLANDLDTLLPNVLLAQKRQLPLVYDSHEIFTEQPSVQGRWVQGVWRFLEKHLIKKVGYMMTESFSYAQWFNEKYGVNPLVVRNIPFQIKEEIETVTNQPKVILYQGALNQARGIPQMIKAMHQIENAVFKIVGDGPQRKDYEKVAEEEKLLGNKVQFLGRMSPQDLRKFTRTADVGVALEENNGLSYYLSLPNKIADYIQSRVPIVMINFPEMKKVYADFKVGEMIENHHPDTIAQAVNRALNNGKNYYREALDNAAEVLCWEHEEAKILDLFRRIEMENFH